MCHYTRVYIIYRVINLSSIPEKVCRWRPRSVENHLKDEQGSSERAGGVYWPSNLSENYCGVKNERKEGTFMNLKRLVIGWIRMPCDWYWNITKCFGNL